MMEKIEILQKYTEGLRSNITSFGEASWKMRAWGFGIWGAMISYGFDKSSPQILFSSSIVLIAILLLESGYRRIQEQFIEKLKSSERHLNEFLYGINIEYEVGTIDSTLQTPNFADFIYLFRLKRWLFWFPYFLGACISFAGCLMVK